MAERLTEKDKYGNNAIFQKKDKFTIAKDKNNDIRVYGKTIDKLAQLEDIMEKYGIEDLEQYLQRVREIDKELRDTIQQLHTIIDTIGYDRDTWKKACEFLAYKYAEEYFDGRDIEHCFNANKRDKFVKENINYFYQQAKKEGNDE